jgi:hypothetical protein
VKLQKENEEEGIEMRHITGGIAAINIHDREWEQQLAREGMEALGVREMETQRMKDERNKQVAILRLKDIKEAKRKEDESRK